MELTPCAGGSPFRRQRATAPHMDHFSCAGYVLSRPASWKEGMTRVPLSVLDLAHIGDGFSAAQTLANSVDLAQRAERLGFVRHWFAEHHSMPSIASS